MQKKETSIIVIIIICVSRVEVVGSIDDGGGGGLEILLCLFHRVFGFVSNARYFIHTRTKKIGG